ncbi:MAG: winged helix-turn-helix domain-containing protein [Nitrososphaerales archaeon]
MQSQEIKEVTASQPKTTRGKSIEIRTRAGIRSSVEIVAAILKSASHNGGEPITTLRRTANISPGCTQRYVSFMLERKLLSVVQPYDRSAIKLYQPTESGYEFLLKQRELISLVESDDEQDLFHFWD